LARRDIMAMRETRFHVSVDALKILDVAVIACLAQEGGLNIGRRAIRELTLAGDAEVCLRQVLTTLPRGIVLYNFILVKVYTPARKEGTVHRSCEDAIGNGARG
jgi:hypothetical protein